MKAFTLTPDLNITAYASPKDAFGTGRPTFGSAEVLDQLLVDMQIKPVDLWNSLPGLTPVKKFMSRGAGLKRIMKQLEGLEAAPEPVVEKKATAKKAAKAAKANSTPETARTPREGSKQQQVVDMMKQPEGATLTAIMAATDWQKHTVRGFIAGAAQKKLGLQIESFKNESGERTYRVIAER